MERRTVVYRGRVQGVFFRATTEDIARRFDVTGWVRNERDGSVTLLAEGDASELDRFLDAIAEAKRPNIESVDVTTAPADGSFDRFSITR